MRCRAAAAGIGLLGFFAWAGFAFARTQAEERAEFESTVLPILKAHCQPCHFSGGKMYDRLPFDRPETIRKLGTRRLFTRVKDEKDRTAIRAFLGETNETK